MVNRLEPLLIDSFVGGLNLRASTFQLADDESPDLLNVDIDPRGGFYTRLGWERWSDGEIVNLDTTVWKPRNSFVHNWSSGDQYVYVVNAGVVHAGTPGGVFAPLTGPTPAALPHGTDFAAWGNTVYMVNGKNQTSYRRVSAAAPVAMATTFSEVETPTTGVLPRAEFVETHAGYMFVAGTTESAIDYPARLRWSHPNRPDAWRALDYIDIDAGGGRITGIMSFRDHLLIFKTYSMWALYGYDEDSWQLIKVSTSIGCPSITATTRSEIAAYFFSASDKGGIYAYTGDDPVYLSEKLKPAFEAITSFDNVFVSWAGRRLWACVPWTKDSGSTTDVSTTFVFDPDVGQGAWTMYNSPYGALGPILDGSDVDSKFPLAAMWSEHTASMVTLDSLNTGYDQILGAPVLATGDGDIIVTGLGEEIAVTGLPDGDEFDAYYRTRWLHAGWPDRKKSWRRPTFVCRQVDRDTDLIVESFRDYDETNIHRSRTLSVQAAGVAMWTEDGYTDGEDGGFDWTEGGEDDASGTGADWGAQRAGAQTIRGGSMGLARAIQLRVRVSPTTSRRRWGVDAVVAKYVMRRYR